MSQHFGNLRCETPSAAALGSMNRQNIVFQCCNHLTSRTVPMRHCSFRDMCGVSLLPCIGKRMVSLADTSRIWYLVTKNERTSCRTYTSAAPRLVLAKVTDRQGMPSFSCDCHLIVIS